MAGWPLHLGDNAVDWSGQEHDLQVPADGAELWPGPRWATADRGPADYPGAVKPGWAAPGDNTYRQGD